MNYYPWVDAANRLFAAILGLQCLVALILGFQQDQLLFIIMICALIVALPYACHYFAPYRSLTSHAYVVAAQMLSALHIQQGMGLTEVHFQIFSLLAFVSFYKLPALFISSVGFVAVHHLSFFIMQMNGLPVFVLEPDDLYWKIWILHAFFAVAEGGILYYMTLSMRKDSIQELEIQKSVRRLISDPNSMPMEEEQLHWAQSHAPFGQLLTALCPIIKESQRVTVEVSDALKTMLASSDVTERTQKNAELGNTVRSATRSLNFSFEELVRQAEFVKQSSVTSANELSEMGKDVQYLTKYIQQLESELTSARQEVSQLKHECDRISGVIGNIKDIAEQTNLLALNASVEAAQAGDRGKGFAVVADEVRRLSMVTHERVAEVSDASEKLDSLSNNVVARVSACDSLSNTAFDQVVSVKDKMKSLIESNTQAAEYVVDIATAMNRQREAISDISESTSDMAGAAIENQAGIEQIEEKLASLSASTQSLKHSLKRFKV
ncbi:methyl-accepting chemotaxis protein [Alteromonas sp. CYL-A6]|uniref:methyl-accepting chemotaxis protein n=1 Tax=Alteromonas nitratireducens TaxID=3390813 RepID=UPI0034AD66DB